jgi:hypothetical protein
MTVPVEIDVGGLPPAMLTVNVVPVPVPKTVTVPEPPKEALSIDAPDAKIVGICRTVIVAGLDWPDTSVATTTLALTAPPAGLVITVPTGSVIEAPPVHVNAKVDGGP